LAVRRILNGDIEHALPEKRSTDDAAHQVFKALFVTRPDRLAAIHAETAVAPRNHLALIMTETAQQLELANTAISRIFERIVGLYS